MGYDNFMQQQGTYQYGGYQPQQVPKIKNVLSEEEIKELQAKQQQFSLSLTPREQLQAACNHRSINGMEDSLSYDPITGQARCTICGYEFRPLDENEPSDIIQKDCERIVDILHTIKLLYVDMPPEVSKEYFQIIPLINKIPKLYEYAARNFTKHDMNCWNYNQYNMSGISMLQNFNNMFGNGMMGAQPIMNQPQQPYNSYAQPGMPVGMPTAQPPMGNPFGYPGAQQPMMGGYQPQTAGYAYQPQQAATPVATEAIPAAPAQPAAPATETVNQAVNV